MRKFISILLIAVLCFLMSFSVLAQSNEKDTKIEYKFSSKQKEWKELETKKDMLNICEIDEEKLETSSTEIIVDAVLEFPLIVDIFAYNTYSEGLLALKNESDAYLELIEREDAGDVLSNKLFKMKSDETMSKLIIGIILSDELIWESVSDKEKVVKQLEKEGLVNNSEITAKATSAYVYTPEGSSVPVLIRGEELDSWLIWDLNDMFRDAYPNATFLGNSTTNYNCHSYAWYSSSSTNKKWMNNPSAYMSDDSYSEFTSLISATVGTKVFYDTPNLTYSHSAVVKTNAGPISSTDYLQLKSKWGQGPLMAHRADYCPYDEDYITLWK